MTELKKRLAGLDGPAVADLGSVVDHLVRRSVWIVGGDGWAYDIGSGGVGPPVAADDPYAAPHQVVDHAFEIGHGRGPSRPSGRFLEFGPPVALRPRVPDSSVYLGGVQDWHRPGRRRPRPPLAQRRGPGQLRSRPAGSRAEFGVASTANWTRPVPGRRRWSSTAWSAGCRRRSTSIRWRWRPSAVAEELREQLEIRVSPQPAQAPENSNSGSRYCVPRTVRNRPGTGR